MVFGAQARPAIVAANPSMKVTEVAKILGADWRGLDDASKSQYNVIAEENKRKYNIAKEQYEARVAAATAVDAAAAPAPVVAAKPRAKKAKAVVAK
jgi:hypothetical protein